MTDESKKIGAALERARRKKGEPILEIWAAVRDRLGIYTPTPETIRAYHQGKVQKPDALIVAALADVYGLTLDQLSPGVAELGNRARDLLGRVSTWIADLAA